ncbi:MAG: IS110 family transposase [Solirubrobacterales bacterium]|nr:IS110 family transposase [Solirubrobacterales bacterium]
MGNCAGIDWASEKHDVLIEDPAGQELLAETFVHDEDGVSALCAALVCFEVEVVAIERPDGLLVDRLLEAGVRVLALHPNQVKAARDRFRASGGKSDRFDRFVLCELARTDTHRFRLLEPDSDQTKAVRALVRAREDLVAARVALSNQLRAELQRFWPGPVGLFSALDSPISLAFLARYPSPGDAHGLAVKRLEAFLKAHRYGGRKTAGELLARLRSAPAGRAGEIETLTRRSVVLRVVRTLQTMVEQIGELEREISEALDAHPDGDIFRSFFRSRESVICAATMLSEIGDSRERYPHRDAIAADGGQAPVAKESGKRKQAKFRWACNKRLRNALSTLAHSSRQWNPWAAQRYAAARARGHNHRRALRTLGRAWTRIIWRCWTSRTLYDPKRHTGLQRHISVTIPGSSDPRPDLAATQRMAGATVTHRAARSAEREALDGKPAAAISAQP